MYIERVCCCKMFLISCPRLLLAGLLQLQISQQCGWLHNHRGGNVLEGERGGRTVGAVCHALTAHKKNACVCVCNECG